MHILQWPAPLTQLNISKQLPNQVLDIKTFHQILNCIYHKCNFVFYGHKAIKKKKTTTQNQYLRENKVNKCNYGLWQAIKHIC